MSKSNIITPADLRRFSAERRYAATPGAPQSFDRKTRSVTAVLSTGASVPRAFGQERLRISHAAIDLSRARSAGGLPLLDSHQQSGIDNLLGRIARTWIEGNSLMGRIIFVKTGRGEDAMRMVERGELNGISIGYGVTKWKVFDAEGRELDPEYDRISMNDDLTFEAVRWQLYEASLVTVPADATALIRSLDGGSRSRCIGTRGVYEARARMAARARMIRRMYNVN